MIAEDIPLCYPDGYYTHATGAMVAGTRGDEQTQGRRLGWFRDWVRAGEIGGVRGAATCCECAGGWSSDMGLVSCDMPRTGRFEIRRSRD